VVPWATRPEIADYGIVGDLFTVASQLIKEVGKRK
jgi:electron transfer flavoprotein alpha subunit